MTLRLVSAMFFVLATSNAGAATAPRCGVNVHVSAQRVFAKVDDSEAWREYRSIEDVPAVDPNGGISAQLWTGTGGTSFVRTVEPGEDFWIYTEYCYTKGGQLSRIGFELRTAWGWAYRLESPVENGTIHDASSGFFSTQTEKSIAKPEQADDVSQADVVSTGKPAPVLQIARYVPEIRLTAKSEMARSFAVISSALKTGLSETSP